MFLGTKRGVSNMQASANKNTVVTIVGIIIAAAGLWFIYAEDAKLTESFPVAPKVVPTALVAAPVGAASAPVTVNTQQIASIISSFFPPDGSTSATDSEDSAVIPTEILLDPQLVNQIQDKEAAKETIAALARLPFGETESFFSAYLAQENLDLELRIAALEALGQTPGNPSSLLLQYLKDVDPEIRAAAAWGLANLEMPGNIAPQLMAHLKAERDADVRTYVKLALKNQKERQP
jgi:hypothetical protein